LGSSIYVVSVLYITEGRKETELLTAGNIFLIFLCAALWGLFPFG